MKTHSLLPFKIYSPDDLRALSICQIPQACRELRQLLIGEITSHGGHFAAGLGVVDLTVALHYVYDTPRDLLIWDVGHQCYPHKIITNRRDKISTIRKKGGLAPFPLRQESEYDTFGVGHAGTSVSAALGMAIGKKLQGGSSKIAAVIGDGGMSSGVAFEAINHLGELNLDILIVLNDNAMSISPNVGALHNYLTRLVSSAPYKKIISETDKMLSTVRPVHDFAKKTRKLVQTVLSDRSIFEELGLQYFGPVDGNNAVELIHLLGNIKQLPGAKILHIKTKKGKGHQQAEDNPVKYHAISGKNKFGPSLPTRQGTNGLVSSSNPQQATVKNTKTLTYTEVFSQWLCDMAQKDSRLVAITPAMREGSGLIEFSRRFPDRYFDVAIAEQHAVTLAAGLACAGMKPIVAIYSTFLQRAYDQLIHDVALQNLPVLFAVDRAGVVGPDGPTHGGIFDLSFMRCVPNMTILAPADEYYTRKMLSTAYQMSSPSAVRYARGKGPGREPCPTLDTIPVGKGSVVSSGSSGIALLSFGTLLHECVSVGNALQATVADMRFVKPLDTALVDELAQTHKYLVTIEDNVAMGGAGSAVNECLFRHRASARVLNLGLPDHFQSHASREELLAEAGLDHCGMLAAIHEFSSDKALPNRVLQTTTSRRDCRHSKPDD